MTPVLAAALVAWCCLVAVYAAGHWLTWQAMAEQGCTRGTCRWLAALWPGTWAVGVWRHHG